MGSNHEWVSPAEAVGPQPSIFVQSEEDYKSHPDDWYTVTTFNGERTVVPLQPAQQFGVDAASGVDAATIDAVMPPISLNASTITLYPSATQPPLDEHDLLSVMATIIFALRGESSRSKAEPIEDAVQSARDILETVKRNIAVIKATKEVLK